MIDDPPEWQHLQPDPAHGDYLNEAGKRALAEARARRQRLAEIAAARPDPGGPAALIRAIPHGFTIRAWEPKTGLWLSRLWALISVETWLREHLDSRETIHPAGLFRDHKSKREHCATLLVELRDLAAECWDRLCDLGIREHEAILAQDFAVWRSGDDFAFLGINRGDGSVVTFRELERRAVIYSARLGDVKPREHQPVRLPASVERVDAVKVRLHVYRTAPGSFSIREGFSGTCEPGDEWGVCEGDPLEGVVALALSHGLPHMKLLWSGDDDVSGIVVAMTAGNDAAVKASDRRLNPLIQRQQAQERRARREAGRMPDPFSLPTGRLFLPKRT